MANYDPFADPQFMSKKMLNYFREKLTAKRDALQARLASFDLPAVGSEVSNEKEELVRYSIENEITLQASARTRLLNYLTQLESALARIADGSYGYCGKTKCPISLRRLEIQPTAIYSIEAQEQIEEQEEQEQLRLNLKRQESY